MWQEVVLLRDSISSMLLPSRTTSRLPCLKPGQCLNPEQDPTTVAYNCSSYCKSPFRPVCLHRDQHVQHKARLQRLTHSHRQRRLEPLCLQSRLLAATQPARGLCLQLLDHHPRLQQSAVHCWPTLALHQNQWLVTIGGCYMVHCTICGLTGLSQKAIFITTL